MLLALISVPDVVLAFQPSQQIIVTLSQQTGTLIGRAAVGTVHTLYIHPQHAYFTAGAGSRMRLNMVFDFLRKRSEEGLAQVQNIATKTIQGKHSCLVYLYICLSVYCLSARRLPMN